MKRLAAAIGLVAVLVSGALVAGALAGNASLASIAQLTTGTDTTTTTVTTPTTTVPTTITTTPPARKVPICHHTRSKKNPHHTITVSVNAVPAHLRHGDTPGPCLTGRNITKHSKAAHVKKFHKSKTLRAEVRSESRGKGKGKGKGKGR